MYKYEDQKHEIEKHQSVFLEIRDRCYKMLNEAGEFTMENAIKGINAVSSWTLMACVDRLVELGEIMEIKQSGYVIGQHRVFVSNRHPDYGVAVTGDEVAATIEDQSFKSPKLKVELYTDAIDHSIDTHTTPVRNYYHNRNLDPVSHSIDRHSTPEERRIACINRAYPKQPHSMTAEEKKYSSICEPGCKRFSGGEVKHDKNCYAYNDSLSKIYDDLQSQLDQLKKEIEELLVEKEVRDNRIRSINESLLNVTNCAIAQKHHAEEMAKAIEYSLQTHETGMSAYKADQMLKQALTNFREGKK